MNSKHARTLAAVFRDPAPSGVAWKDVEALLIAVGRTVIEGSESRLKFEKNGVVGGFHRPHPAKEAKPYQVRNAREFLTKIGVTP